METQEKRRTGLSALGGILILLAVAAGLVFFRPRWGFAREVSPEEAQKRCSVVETAESFYGYSEEDGRYREIIDLYNSHQPLAQNYQVQYTDSWCAAFVSAVSIRCGITDILPTECSCQRQIGLFQELDRWEERDSYRPLPGDIIYYCWNRPPLFGDCTGWSSHVGIVVGTAGPFIKVIEGNKSDRVAYRYILQNDFRIRGFGLPDYGAAADTVPQGAVGG